MWLTELLLPDHKTIADLLKDYGSAVRQVCREFVDLCLRLELFQQAIAAIDGSKFQEVNNRNSKFTPTKMKQRLEQLDKLIRRYLSELCDAGRGAGENAVVRSARLQEKIATIDVMKRSAV